MPLIKDVLPKFVLLLFLALVTLRAIFDPDVFQLVNGANLLFHEAGHVFFGFLGEYIGMWGGTLLQFLIPLGLTLAFCAKKQAFSASIMFYWFGQNFVDTHDYIQDAQAQKLPLVGGGLHDWYYILTHAGLLRYDQEIGAAVFILGILLMFVALGWGAFATFRSQTKG